MHAYLIISKTKELVDEKAKELAQKENAVLTPFTLQKIADVRDLSNLTKLSLRMPTAFYITNIENASLDALNAFLKQLEEPRKNTFFVLSASSEEKILPTIVSRCQVIRVQQAVNSGLSHHIDFCGQSINEQFTIMDKIKKRDEAIAFLQSLIEETHQLLVFSTTTHRLATLTKRLEEASRTLTALEKNGNVTIQLTRLIVGLNKNNNPNDDLTSFLV